MGMELKSLPFPLHVRLNSSGMGQTDFPRDVVCRYPPDSALLGLGAPFWAIGHQPPLLLKPAAGRGRRQELVHKGSSIGKLKLAFDTY